MRKNEWWVETGRNEIMGKMQHKLLTVRYTSSNALGDSQKEGRGIQCRRPTRSSCSHLMGGSWGLRLEWDSRDRVKGGRISKEAWRQSDSFSLFVQMT